MTDRNQHDTGKNMGRGIAGANDNQRRDLLNRGGDQRTQGQRNVRSSDEGRAKDDPSCAPESGTP